MKKSEVLAQIKEATKGLRLLFNQNLKFEVIVDEDGRTIQYAELAVGAEVYIGTPDGSEVAPDGEYKVDEFTSFTVKDGKIESIESTKEDVDADVEVIAEVFEEGEDSPEDAPSDEPAPDAPKTIEDVMQELLEINASLVSEVGLLRGRIEALEGTMETKVEEADIEELQEIVAEFARTPFKKPAKKDMFASQKVEENARMKDLSSIFGRKSK